MIIHFSTMIHKDKVYYHPWIVDMYRYTPVLSNLNDMYRYLLSNLKIIQYTLCIDMYHNDSPIFHSSLSFYPWRSSWYVPIYLSLRWIRPLAMDYPETPEVWTSYGSTSRKWYIYIYMCVYFHIYYLYYTGVYVYLSIYRYKMICVLIYYLYSIYMDTFT